MAIYVSYVASGLSVKIPFELKDNFKNVFKTARWDPQNKTWLVSSQAQARLEQWIAAVQPVIDDMDEAQECELSANELAELQLQVAEIRLDLVKQQSAKKDLEVTKALLAKSKLTLDSLKQERVIEQQKALELENELIDMLNSVCDMDAVMQARKTMIDSYNKVSSRARESFKAASLVIQNEHHKLRNAGFRSAGMEELASMNHNRPDRDVPANISLKDLLVVQKL